MSAVEALKVARAAGIDVEVEGDFNRHASLFAATNDVFLQVCSNDAGTDLDGRQIS